MSSHSEGTEAAEEGMLSEDDENQSDADDGEAEAEADADEDAEDPEYDALALEEQRTGQEARLFGDVDPGDHDSDDDHTKNAVAVRKQYAIQDSIDRQAQHQHADSSTAPDIDEGDLRKDMDWHSWNSSGKKHLLPGDGGRDTQVLPLTSLDWDRQQQHGQIRALDSDIWMPYYHRLRGGDQPQAQVRILVKQKPGMLLGHA